MVKTKENPQVEEENSIVKNNLITNVFSKEILSS